VKAKGDTLPGTVYLAHAKVAGKLGDQKRAEKYYREALKKDEKLLGKGHPNVARDAFALAQLYAGRDDQKKADKYYQQTMRVVEQNPDAAYPIFEEYIAEYAEFLRAQSRDTEADHLLERFSDLRQGSAE
jgi:tetratricopeptide (TPR) repeat protein